jgi:hypothetical protein
MTMRTVDVEVITSAMFYGARLDIPDEVWVKGQAAVLKWCQENKLLVDMARASHTETCIVQEVTGVQID